MPEAVAHKEALLLHLGLQELVDHRAVKV
jgi:hypothetical protein